MARIVVLSRRDIRHPLSGGASRYVHEVLRRLATHHSITVLSGGIENGDPEEVIDGVTYLHLSGKLQRLLLPIRFISKHAGKTDLLIDNSDVGIPWLSPLYSRQPRITIIHQLVREIFYDEFPRPISDVGFALEPLVYRFYSDSRIVAASRSTARDLERFGIRAENIEVIEPGCSNLGSSKVALAERSQQTIGCVSRLVKYKGLQLALKALSRIVPDLPEVKLLVAGSGPYQSDLSRTARILGISKNVSFLGRISEESKFKLYGQTRVAIYPSYREGFGISILEANSVGTPVVGWNVPGTRDAIIDAKTGLLAPLPDDATFANHLLTLLTDDRRWQELSDSAWKWAQEHSWERCAKQFEATVEHTLLPKGS